MTSDLDWRLSNVLRDFPAKYKYRYREDAATALLETLFRSLTADRPDFLAKLFPNGPGESDQKWKLSEAQGAQEGTEYTAAARGHRCGHILKNGEASYHCHTCSDDPTACLCSRCFDASDHEGHSFSLSQSMGNSGCCDCGDNEAWKIPVNCAIHTASQEEIEAAKSTHLPKDWSDAIRITIGRALDYFCDVFSCSPENLRNGKTEETIRQDEELSRLLSKYYGSDPEQEANPEFALIIWNDEKHTIDDVESQVSRACKERKDFGTKKANEANDYGRSVVKHSSDLTDLLRICKIIEQIKITVTIRPSRDTFREQMCGTIVEWLTDLAACHVDGDSFILRQTICEEMLQLWRIGSKAWNAKIGKQGMDDHGQDDKVWDRRRNVWLGMGARQVVVNVDDSDDDDEIDPAEPFDGQEFVEQEDEEIIEGGIHVEETADGMDVDIEQIEESAPVSENDGDTDMGGTLNDELQAAGTVAEREETPTQAQTASTSPLPVAENDELLTDPTQSRNYMNIPKTPSKGARPMPGNSSKHWMTSPKGHKRSADVPIYEDLTKNIRLDSMILFDLRLWKKTRVDLRDLYISTVVNIPEFKRILGLRFAGLYTQLASLFLISDREPDHSIINLSLQMLTSQSITDEVIESGNFLTNLMAILYTFLTTRNVGLPQDVNSTATLAFDAGSVNNRRLYHFFTDLRHFLKSEAVQKRVRTEEQYLRQFLDLIKLAQGICPNVRAVGEHVEYETDAWISASLLSREINKLCREFPEAFRLREKEDVGHVTDAILFTTMSTITNSVGAERSRFQQAEVREIIKFKRILPYDFDFDEEFRKENGYPFSTGYRVVDFVVSQGQVSFHHPLHYTLSWLLEGAKSLSCDEIRIILWSAANQSRANFGSQVPQDLILAPEDALLAMFDYPLRVCAWLAQMRANLWVRNGLSLRHQMSQYKGVQLRDVAYHRDIFLLQTAFVTCDPSRVLATVIDRFDLDDWMRGQYISKAINTEEQLVDILEDFTNLLIVILSDRASLITLEEEPNPHLVAMWKDVIHTLCFKPLSYSDLINRLNERVQDQPEFPKILSRLANYRAPEGLTDTGMFELRPEYFAELDPYSTNYTKNQRDEAENIYKNWMSKKLNKDPADIVPEPKLRQITTGAYIRLNSFTKEPLFAQVIYYSLGLTLKERNSDIVPVTRIEALLQVILQLVLIATLEDEVVENTDFEGENATSFIQKALKLKARRPISPGVDSIMSVLQQISLKEEFSSCRSKIKHILRVFCRKRPADFVQATASMTLPYDRLDTSSPANTENDAELKKKQALERQKRVMAQFQQQQQSFMQNQGFADWGDADLSDEEADMPESTESKMWKYPTGVCILCQEETNDSRLYGTFAMLSKSNLIRTTDLKDRAYVHEAIKTPISLDRTADDIRPFGVAGDNHAQVRVLDSSGRELLKDRQGLGRGFPRHQAFNGPVSTSCGHIMHYACFENYCQAIQRRQHHQIARNHPEILARKEFVCPLCKALGNAFLPIIWKGKEESYPGVLVPKRTFQEMMAEIPERISRLPNPTQPVLERDILNQSSILDAYVKSSFISDLASGFDTLQVNVGSPMSASGIQSHMARLPMPGGMAPEYSRRNSTGETLTPIRQPTSPTPFKELQKIYGRLQETIRANFVTWSWLRAEIASLDAPHHSFWTLATTYGYSVAALEIAHRGFQADVGMTLLDRISQQSLTHLRTLAETSFSFYANAFLEKQGTPNGSLQMRGETGRLLRIMFAELFPLPYDVLHGGHNFNTTLLSSDIFCCLAEKALVLCPLLDLDIHHLVKLCYIAEIVKVFLAYMDQPDALQSIAKETGLSAGDSFLDCTSANAHSVQSMIRWLARQIEFSYDEQVSEGLPNHYGDLSPEACILLHQLARHYALPFLRKVTVLLHTGYGVEFPSSGLSEIETPELDRLTRLLRVPTVEEVISIFQNDYAQTAEHEQIRGLASYWIKNHCQDLDMTIKNHQPGSSIEYLKTHRVAINLPHPGILELVGLPKYYDVLMEETQKRKCPTTGKDLTDPSVCLFCGEIFCSQAKCCTNESRKGGCNQHMEK